jgi:hypothetical protein
MFRRIVEDETGRDASKVELSAKIFPCSCLGLSATSFVDYGDASAPSLKSMFDKVAKSAAASSSVATDDAATSNSATALLGMKPDRVSDTSSAARRTRKPTGLLSYMQAAPPAQPQQCDRNAVTGVAAFVGNETDTAATNASNRRSTGTPAGSLNAYFVGSNKRRSAPGNSSGAESSDGVRDRMPLGGSSAVSSSRGKTTGLEAFLATGNKAGLMKPVHIRASPFDKHNATIVGSYRRPASVTSHPATEEICISSDEDDDKELSVNTTATSAVQMSSHVAVANIGTVCHRDEHTGSERLQPCVASHPMPNTESGSDDSGDVVFL